MTPQRSAQGWKLVGKKGGVCILAEPVCNESCGVGGNGTGTESISSQSQWSDRNEGVLDQTSLCLIITSILRDILRHSKSNTGFIGNQVCQASHVLS